MKAIDRLKYGFRSKEYFISIYPDHIYVINYKDIIDFTGNNIILEFNDFKLKIKGLDFKIIRKNNCEIDILGFFNSMEIING